MRAEDKRKLEAAMQDLQQPKYRLVLFGMGAAIPEVYELGHYETAKHMFYQSTDGVCYRKAYIVELGPHASWRMTDHWGFADGPTSDMARA